MPENARCQLHFLFERHLGTLVESVDIVVFTLPECSAIACRPSPVVQEFREAIKS